jgi:hypothetical protein
MDAHGEGTARPERHSRMTDRYVAECRCIALQKRCVASGYVTLLRSCYGTVAAPENPSLFAVAELLRKGGFSPFLSSTVAALVLRGPQLQRAVAQAVPKQSFTSWPIKQTAAELLSRPPPKHRGQCLVRMDTTPVPC